MVNTVTPLFTTLRFIERAAAYLQGKGYGSSTINREVKVCSQQLLSTPLLAVDIGGNVGNYSKRLRKLFNNLEIHIFEPSITNVEKLNKLFGSDTKISIIPMALSDNSSTSTLYSNEPGGGLGSLVDRRLTHFGLKLDYTEEVRVIRFENYWSDVLKERPIDIAKLDIEGFELNALRGFGRALHKTRVIQFEFGGCNIDSKTTFQDFFYFFKDEGFSLYRIAPIGIELLDRYREADEYYLTTNFIAVNNKIGLPR